jgi:antitoxin MazE
LYHASADRNLEPLCQKTRIVKWKNSLAVRIPKAFAKRARLTKGDMILIEEVDGCVKLRTSDTIPTLEELVAKITPENCHEEIKWGPPVVGELVGW